MKRFNVFSVQFNNCSDYAKRQINSLLAQKTHYPSQAPCCRRFTDPARLSDRTLHSLWQAGMQVCRGSRSRPQILSLCQLPWPQTGTGLCAPTLPGASKTISRQLPEGKTNPRGDLQHQPRALTSERKTVKDLYGYHFRYLYTHRYYSFKNHSCQFAPGFYCRSIQRNRFTGGDR